MKMRYARKVRCRLCNYEWYTTIPEGVPRGCPKCGKVRKYPMPSIEEVI